VPVIAVFGDSSIKPASAAFAEAVRLGRLLGAAGHAVMTGGYGGVMEAVSMGAREAGGETIGVTVPDVFPHRSSPNEHVTQERQAVSLIARIGELVEGSDACIALEGSIGTFTEFMVAWNLAFVARFTDAPPKPVITVGSLWRPLVATLADELDTDASLITSVSTVNDAVTTVDRLLQA
jgi:uncharacterized protein (TIGR00730 family)